MPKPAIRHRAPQSLAPRTPNVPHAGRAGVGSARATPRVQTRPARTFEDLVLTFDRELVGVDVECNALDRAVATQDVLELEHAAYAVAAAWFLAESAAMRILAVQRGVEACQRFARSAVLACSGIVTARFGHALAETSKWAAFDPMLPGLGRLRAVLGQLAARVDVRINVPDVGAARAHAARRRPAASPRALGSGWS